MLVPLLNCNANRQVVKCVFACNTLNLKLYLQENCLGSRFVTYMNQRPFLSSALNVYRCTKICYRWRCCFSLLLCFQIPPPLPAQPACASSTWRWATKAWWQPVSTGPCQRSPISPYITTKCSGAGLCPPSRWCRPRRKGERPPTG